VDELLVEQGIEVDQVKPRSYTALSPAKMQMGADCKSVG
jgi:hypothetical protein